MAYKQKGWSAFTQKPSKEKENPLARWLVAVKSGATFGTWEYGDMYVREITSHSTRTK